MRFQNNWPVGYTIEEGEVGIFAKTFGVTEVIGHRNDQEIDGQTVQGRRRMKKYIFACSETHEPSNCTIAGQDRWRLFNLHTRGIYCGIEQCASSGPIRAPPFPRVVQSGLAPARMTQTGNPDNNNSNYKNHTIARWKHCGGPMASAIEYSIPRRTSN